MHAFRRVTVFTVVIGAILGLSATRAAANTICDLTVDGSSCSIGSGLFFTDEQHPTGTGYIDSFLRVQQNTWEQGYNTSDRSYSGGGHMQPTIQDKTDPNYTRDLKVSDLSTKTINGTLYAEFFLDINEPASAGKSTLTLDQLEIYTSNTASLKYYGATAANDGSGCLGSGGSGSTCTGTTATKVYDMDTALSDNWVNLDYGVSGQGSGSSDMVFYIPRSLLTGNYVYLFSQFGQISGATKYKSEDGFEEWWSKSSTDQGQGSLAAVPEPGSLALLGIGLLALGRYRRRVSARP